jgi:hypothetical protein
MKLVTNTPPLREKHPGRTRNLRGMRYAIVWSLVTWAGFLFLLTRCGR